MEILAIDPLWSSCCANFQESPAVEGIFSHAKAQIPDVSLSGLGAGNEIPEPIASGRNAPKAGCCSRDLHWRELQKRTGPRQGEGQLCPTPRYCTILYYTILYFIV